MRLVKGVLLMSVNISEVPHPFKEFLVSKKEVKTASIPEEPQNQVSRENDMQDLLFLAAILLLTDE